MKNRDYKIFAPNNYYHVYNRGNGKQEIFLDKEDYLFFLGRLQENLFPPTEGAPRGANGYQRKLLPKDSFSLICYCLMPNHFHWLIKQNSSLKISKILLKVCTSYSIYFNKKYKHVGHVFQDQFKAIQVDSDSYLIWLSAYIHQNPKVAGVVADLKDWKFSSYLSYIGLRSDTLCDDKIILTQFKNQSAYEDFVEKSFYKTKARKDLLGFLLDDE